MSNKPMISKFSQPRRVKYPIMDDDLRQKLYFMKNWDMIFIHAPEGYGKTTSVQIALRELNCSAAWFFVDEYDDSPKEFCQGMVNSLSAIQPEEKNDYLKTYKGLLYTEGSSKAALIEVLNRIPTRYMPDAVIIDGFHNIKSNDVTGLLPVIHRHLPLSTTLIIISRTLPPSSFSSLFMKDKVASITAEDLRFSHKGIQTYLKKHGLILSQSTMNTISQLTGGWPLALNAVIHGLKNGADIFNENDLTSIKSLIDYIHIKTFGNMDKQDMKKIVLTGMVSVVTTEYCKQALGFDNCEAVLSTLERDTGLVHSPFQGGFKYNSLFRTYLESMLSELDSIDKESGLIKTIQWLCNNKQLLEAWRLATHHNMSKYLKPILIRIFSANNLDLKQIMKFVTPLSIKQIPLYHIQSSPLLCAICICISFANGDLTGMRKLIRTMQGLLYTEYTWVMALDPKCSVKEKLIFLKDYMRNDFPLNLKSFLMTLRLPFFHKSIFDYAELSSSANAISDYGVIMPFLTEPMFTLLTAGACYERNQQEQALHLLYSCEHGIDGYIASYPELFFCHDILIAEILFIQNKKKAAYAILERQRSLVHEQKLNSLQENLYAYEISRSLYDGDTGAADEWLTKHKPCHSDNKKLYLFYQNTVTAKALILSGKVMEAIDLLESLICLCKRFNQWIDLIETLAICAICHAKVNQYCKADLYINEALLLANEQNIITPFVLLGTDITYMLKRALSKKRVAPQDNSSVIPFISNILVLAEENKHSYGLFNSTAMIKPKLSKRQQEMLNMLSKNYTYAEIAEATQTKITTVREHITKLYEKLQVSDSKNAILKARQLGLLEK